MIRAIVCLAILCAASNLCAAEPPPCPITDGPCECGCADGKPCTCGKQKKPVVPEAKKPVVKLFQPVKGEWLQDTDGSYDLGYWKGRVFMGCYRPGSGKYFPYDGAKYVGPIQLTPPQKPIAYRKECDGQHCKVTPIYSRSPPAVAPPE